MFDVMPTDPEESFDDPELKAAVRRVWGGKPTPESVRRRLEASTTGLARDSAMTIRPRYVWAAAALVVIAVGLIALKLNGIVPVGPGPQAAAAAAPLPATLASDLVARHDGCARAADHHMPGVARDDFARIASDLKWRLGLPVMAGPIKEDQWTFAGASICPVGSFKSAHLMFKGPHHQAVSVFSLTGAALPSGVDGRAYEADRSGHPIAGFMHDGSFYCVVGSDPTGSLSLKEVRTFRDELAPQIDIPRPTVASAEH